MHCSPTLGCCPCSGGGSVLVDLLFNVLPIVCGNSLCLPLFVMYCFEYFLDLQSS